MRILHITEYCHAGSVGGTERYILDLCRSLDANGIESAIGWLKASGPIEDLTADNVRIRALPAPAMRVDAFLPQFPAAASALLANEKPDLVHFHTFGASEALLAEMARDAGIPYVFTYHSPAWTCRRETMLLHGETPCDGEVRAWRCSTCQAGERLGSSPLAGAIATTASVAAGWATMPLGATTLRRRSAFFYDTWNYRRRLRKFLAQCDLVVSCCDWSGPVLLKNGARPETIRNFPQGVSTDFVSAIAAIPANAVGSAKENFTVGCIGRLNPVKGVHLLVKAFTKLAPPAMRLRIVGWEPENAGTPYAAGIKKFAEADSRIALVPKTSLRETVREYCQLSLLAVPSIWLETGPLTLMEAAAAGVPVYGSSRIGQSRLLQERGRIVEPNTVEAWQQALAGAFERHQNGKWDQEILRARGNAPVRTMGTVATEMICSYREVLAHD